MTEKINGKTKVLAVIGDPIEHSLSPEIHNTLCRHLNLNYVYVPFKVSAANLEDAIKGFKAAGIAGFNVTIPHKNSVIRWLDDISLEAKLMGAVNTVKLTAGRLEGFNTDGTGFIRSLKSENIEVKGKKIVILGAGGAARGIAIKMAMEGASDIIIINRSTEKAQEISRIINQNINKVAKADSYHSLHDHGKNCDILINTTPLGMSPNENSCPVEDLCFLSESTIVCDLIYNPRKTIFLRKAEEKGCKTVNGLGMLIYQAVEAFEIWTGIKVKNELISILQNFLP